MWRKKQRQQKSTKRVLFVKAVPFLAFEEDSWRIQQHCCFFEIESSILFSESEEKAVAVKMLDVFFKYLK